jgi:hypothetical protein
MLKFVPNSFPAFILYSLFALLLLILVSNSVYANNSLPPTLEKIENSLDKKNFISIGQTTFTVLFWDIYTSQLLTSSGKYPLIDSKDDLLFDINYLTSIKSEDLIKRTIEQWQHLGIPEDKYQIYLPLLKNMWPDIQEGDNLSILIHQGRSIFYFNKQYLGVIDDLRFGEIFLAIWLSEKTSQPSLRNELLGKASKESE